MSYDLPIQVLDYGVSRSGVMLYFLYYKNKPHERVKAIEMTDHNEICEAASDIIKNVTPGNPNAMVASNKAIALALISIAQDVHAMRGDMDEMRKMTRTLDEIRVQLGFRR